MDVEGLAELRIRPEVERVVEAAMREFLAYSLDRQPRSLAFLDEVRAGGVAVGPGRSAPASQMLVGPTPVVFESMTGQVRIEGGTGVIKDLGAKAAHSHTAALTGMDARYDAVFAQYGVIRVQDYDDLLEVSQLLAHCPKPSVPGIAVVSHSGGISSLTADMCGQAGLDLPPLGEEARDGINGILKDFGWAANPADVTGFANSAPQLMEH
jgi:hypothetical protein